jgi:hypothetical protein
MIDLPDAGSAYLIACASTGVANAGQLYTDAIAQARLTLADSQADAHLKKKRGHSKKKRGHSGFCCLAAGHLLRWPSCHVLSERLSVGSATTF